MKTIESFNVLESFGMKNGLFEEVNGFSSLNVLPHSQRYTLRFNLISRLFSLAEACLIV